MNNDLISRSELKKALHNFFDGKVIDEPTYILRDVFCHIDNAPTVELTEEQAIDKLHETGWLIRHDKEMTERPHIIDNCDMNVFEPEKYMEGGAE